MAALLGKIPDEKLAGRAGVDCGTVAAERRRRGIEACHPHRAAIEWTPDMIAQLGTAGDKEVASDLGISFHSVSYKRRLLKIPPFNPAPYNRGNAPFAWRPEDLALLGKMPDRRLAAQLGISESTVHFKRQRLGIPAFRPHRRIRWSEEMLELLGRVRDSDVAEQYGIPKKSVYLKRTKLGIPAAFASGLMVVRTPEIADLLRLPTLEVQRRSGLSVETIKRLRAELDISAPTLVRWRWDLEILARLGKEPDATLARDFGVPLSSVENKRRALGIPPFRPRRGSRPKRQPVGVSPEDERTPSEVERTSARPRCVLTEELAARLGQIPDAKLAELAGVSAVTIVAERQRRGIEAFRLRRADIEWTPEMIAQLGTAGDREVAQALGISQTCVRRKRARLGIRPFHILPRGPSRRFPWTAEDLALLGKLTDKEVAVRLGVTVTTVARRRQELGIPPSRPWANGIQWTEEMVELLGTATDAEVAMRYGISPYSVFRKRTRLGIPAFLQTRAVVRTPELTELLRLPTPEARRRTGLHRSTISQLRKELGITVAESPE